MLGYYLNDKFTFKEPGSGRIVDEDGQYCFQFMEAYFRG